MLLQFDGDLSFAWQRLLVNSSYLEVFIVIYYSLRCVLLICTSITRNKRIFVRI